MLQKTSRPFIESGVAGIIFDYAPAGLNEPQFRDKLINEGIYSATITSLPATRKHADLIKKELDQRGIVVTIEELADVAPPYLAEEPSVLYYANSSQSLASQLAVTFRKLTGLSFEATRGSTPPKGPTLRFAIHCVPPRASVPVIPMVQTPLSNTPVTNPIVAGWLYYGLANEKDWQTRHFERTDSHPAAEPEPGIVVRARSPVTIRSDYMREDESTGEMKNAPSLGLLREGQSVRVLEVVNLRESYSEYPSYIWIRFGPLSSSPEPTPHEVIRSLPPAPTYWDGDGISGTASIKISLRAQGAAFYKDGKLVGMSQISTGRKGAETPKGEFKIIEKDKKRFFMRLTKTIGLYAGYLPGYPASDGNIRMPEFMAKNFFKSVSIGTPVSITD